MRAHLRSLLFGLCALCAASGFRLQAQVVRVAAASDLRWALEEVSAAFQRDHPGKIQVTYGSSGNFHAQLINKAPFDLFLSADVEYPQDLVQRGLGVKDTRFDYGVGRLVLWVPKASPIPVEKLGLAALGHPSARKIALANPRHAPYGRAAEAALKKAGLLEAMGSKLVLGENISQTAQFVQSGAADIGFLALSLVVAGPLKDQGRWWMVPAEDHPTIRQGGVILTWAQDPALARVFVEYLQGPEGSRIMKQYGFSTGAH
ncbi:MAG: molybdate ABC transporter substrate-binding protein [Acidobacteriota bacterium]|nr:molybdate ABC transporter substrate-binding protein [Acidobacteriota bacterium]